MDDLTFLGNSDINSLDKLYTEYLQNPSEIDDSWRFFFRGYNFGLNVVPESGHQLDKEFKVLRLIDNYRRRGHLFTETNPVRKRRNYLPSLAIENAGLNSDDLQQIFQAGKEIGIGPAPLSEIVAFLEETYCRSIGVEYMFLRNYDKIDWIRERIEKSRNKTNFSIEAKKKIFAQLNQAVGFEQFIHRRFIGQKRFSLEGTETLIPALDSIIELGSALGIREFTFGMAHRGRLNVLGNVIRKPYENIFQEFTAEAYDDSVALGDVKYHLGYSNCYALENGKDVLLNLAPNPSHLEAVSPVIQGISRGRIEKKYNGDFTKLLPVLIHGDAAMAGQGVVYEVLQMVELNGYRTGGAIHLVINNQIGFTTDYLDARSSTYCTDVGRIGMNPIFHVNGDDVEALLHVVRLAMEYRQTYYTDVFIDILSYRKHGHNEGDEPRYTQPTLYKAIANHPDPRRIYAEKLVREGIFNSEEIKKQESDFDLLLEEKLEASKRIGKVKIQQFLGADWEEFKYAERSDFDKHFLNGVDINQLKSIAEKLCNLPADKKFIDKTYKLVDDRKKTIVNNRIDWAMAELLAYGTMLVKGHAVRISGQDSVRGTFAHRHAAHVVEDTDEVYIPLRHLSERQAAFSIYNSPLNEYGVLGFEYGYALASPDGLTVWEAQFGDFHNVAQVIIDQYISSAEEKWGLKNGLVLYLPHGFEGQGPEHSSARIERFLAMAVKNNMHIVQPTTPANFYHILWQQVARNFRVPLIIFTPKSLLRHPECISKLEELSEGTFKPVIDDNNVDTLQVRRVVYCSGKIYYDLLKRKNELEANDVALVRLEQLHPFPLNEIREVAKRYPNSLVNLWVQEEPINMGPWGRVLHEFKDMEIFPIARQASGSPATGLLKIHQLQQEEIISKVFRPCVCEHQYKYCGLQCQDGKIRQEILKQYKYFVDVKS